MSTDLRPTSTDGTPRRAKGSQPGRSFDGGEASLKLCDPLVHPRLEMREPSEQLGLQHKLDLDARVRDAVLEFVEPAVMASQEIDNLKKHRPVLIGVGANLTQDRQHQSAASVRHSMLPMREAKLLWRQSVFRPIASVLRRNS